MKKYLWVVLTLTWVVSVRAQDSSRNEIDVFGGAIDLNSHGGSHGVFGVAGGYGIPSKYRHDPTAQIYAEYSLAPMGASAKLQDVQSGIRLGVKKSDVFEPYTLAGIGAGRFSTDVGAHSIHFGLNAGGGVWIYGKGKRWGVVPELRWTRYFASGPDVNAFRCTGSLFFRWGK